MSVAICNQMYGTVSLSAQLSSWIVNSEFCFFRWYHILFAVVRSFLKIFFSFVMYRLFDVIRLAIFEDLFPPVMCVLSETD